MSSTRPEINIHPTTLLPSPSSLKPSYDVIVLGGGPTGETAATITAAGGLSTLLVETELVGGECPYWACVPSKALLRPGEAIEGVQAVGGARERLRKLERKYGGGGGGRKGEGNGAGSREDGRDDEGACVDMEGMWKRRDMFTKNWDDTANVKMMQGAGVQVVHGFGAIVGARKVSVTSWHGEKEVVEVEAKLAVVVATGSEPVIPDIEGLKEAGFWTPREAVSAREVPEHLIVLGAGAVGTELATAYREFGSKVTLVVHGKVLPKCVPEARKRVEESLKRSGIDVRVGVSVKSAQREGGKVTLALSDGVVVGTEILIATGRRARTVNMGLEKVGAEPNGALVDVDESMVAKSVSSGCLYVAGDPNGIAPTTHMGRYQVCLYKIPTYDID
jgi:pyruvate/2-oxoglutarate dehydrogenase complex dihydrolipoamide dehydrogenase (E3) component